MMKMVMFSENTRKKSNGHVPANTWVDFGSVKNTHVYCPCLLLISISSSNLELSRENCGNSQIEGVVG